MGWLEISCLLAVVIYCVFVLGAVFSARKEKPLQLVNYQPTTKISVIIAARNEEKNIEACLRSLAGQYFPHELLEVIVVNDHSSDKTREVAAAFLAKHIAQYKLIDLAENEKGKKKALTKGIEQSSGMIIVTRDADTFTENTDWLKRIAFHFEHNNTDLLIMPAALAGRNKFTEAFQKFENLAILGIGAGMAHNGLPIVCSGANLAYPKEVFLNMNPYADNIDIPSGDDMFFLKKAFQKKLRITSLNNPVLTPAQSNLKAALDQRLRWAAKGARIATLSIVTSGLILLLGNLAGLVALVCLFIDASYLPFGLFTLSLKLVIDLYLLFLSARMFKIKFNPGWFIPAFVINLVYTPVMTLLPVFVKPAWKGRNT